MTNEQIFKKVDHTILAPTATYEEVSRICEEAVKYKTASVCIPPSYVANMHEKFKELNICTVIGFPLGYSLTKKEEIELAISQGAAELDVVVNIADVKNRKYDVITEELKCLKKACGDKILKVIIETCYLTDEEKIALCKCVTDSSADYIKTSTGFGTGGATIEDIELFKKHIGSNVKIKASGGIRTREAFETYINLGCDRIGTSSVVSALIENSEKGSY